MKIDINKNDSEIIITPIGRLDSTTCDEFSDFLNESITEDINKIVIDFSNVDFISSKGLRVLVSLYKNLNGRKLELTNPNVSVLEVLRLSGLLKVIDVK